MSQLKSRQGFSLVELMVVVAIMGTLAAIAIPAYNEYRRSAKKATYKSDLLSLHKGWLAFGVEIDSFCERETNPINASIANVGMESILSSRLYGENRNADVDASCTGGTLDPASCDPAYGASTNPCTGCTGGGSFSAALPARTGPGKQNFIGFTTIASTCTAGGNAIQQSHTLLNDTATDTHCALDVTDYKMGVYGHISGKDYIGFQIQDTGALSERSAGDPVAISTHPDTTCS